MPVTIDVRDANVDRTAVDVVFAELARIDRLCSTHGAGSEVSRIVRGELRSEDAHPDVRAVLELCLRYELETSGWFSARIRGRLDPTGLVKGWAIGRAGAVLERWGARRFFVDAGGDVLARGDRGDGRPWRVGIRHPVERSCVVRVVLAGDLAVATSGTYEKGGHVLDPHTGLPAEGLVSATVAGPDIVTADVYATAVLAKGPAGLALVEALAGYEAYVIRPDLRASWTSGFDGLCGPPG